MKRGVSINSFQYELENKKMGLEDCLRVIRSTGAGGIDFSANQSSRKWPTSVHEDLKKLQAMMARSGLCGVCYDVSEALDARASADSLLAAAGQAVRFGFSMLLIPYTIPKDRIDICRKKLQETGLKLSIKLSAQSQLSDKAFTRWLPLIRRGDILAGITLDMQLFMKRAIRIRARQYIRSGGIPGHINFIGKSYKEGADVKTICSGLDLRGCNQKDLEWLEEVGSYSRCDFERIKAYMPYVSHIQAKVYEMIYDNGMGEEYSIPYGEIVPMLKAEGYNGYISTDYGGGEFYKDIPGYFSGSAFHVTFHQKLLQEEMEK